MQSLSAVRTLSLCAAFLLLDLIWLTARRPSYNRAVRAVQGVPLTLRPFGALLSYVCILAVFFLFALPALAHASPQKNTNRLAHAARYAGLLGLLVYGVFNFTNMGIFRNYPLSISLQDTLWGGILFTAVGYLALL
jgi:uncharacterized membrane protein